MMRNIDFLILQVFCADLCFLLLHLTEIILTQYRDEINFYCIERVLRKQRLKTYCSSLQRTYLIPLKLQHLSGIRSILLEIRIQEFDLFRIYLNEIHCMRHLFQRIQRDLPEFCRCIVFP